MPLYGWRCEKCNAKTEVLRKFDDYQVPPEKCSNPDCDSKEFRRTIGEDIVVTKGWNWGDGKGNW